MLDLNLINCNGQLLIKLVPEFGELFLKLKGEKAGAARGEIQVSRDEKLENLLVRIDKRENNKGTVEGYVVTFDDVTDLVNAQRMAAWGDVARRIAHEIKNPLTPIQLSAERLKQKFMPIAGANKESLIQYTDVIIRQTGDLRRIVDEFSQFARMPVPQRCLSDLIKIIDDVIHLETSRDSSIAKVLFEKPEPILLMIDPAMITQSLTNLIKNAGEAIETFINKNEIDDYQPIININVSNSELETIITISDNGIGLPKDRTRLFEPYMTTREKGTGAWVANC